MKEGIEDIQHWYAASHAGNLLGVSGQWVTILCRRGELRGVRTALGWLIDPNDVERLRQERIDQLRARLEQATQKRTIQPPSGRGRSSVSPEQARRALRKVACYHEPYPSDGNAAAVQYSS
jgi:2-polyprenyl-6-methoxyphenol hydroxylase-like FAD-dependent oxidoreductase